MIFIIKNKYTTSFLFLESVRIMKRKFYIITLAFTILILIGCSNPSTNEQNESSTPLETVSEVQETVSEAQETVSEAQETDSITKEVEPESENYELQELIIADFKQEGTFEISSDASKIIIDDDSSVLNGLVIDIPADSYEKAVSFTISVGEISNVDFKGLIPISPMIKVDNGERFSEDLIQITIPVKLEPEEIAMAFYYDSESNTLEGIPTVARNDESIVIATHHFSQFFVSKMSKEQLAVVEARGNVDTGFRPEKDGFIFTNYGSAVNPRGHCTGQAVAAMWYYSNIKPKTNQQLYGFLDNDGRFATPKLWQDDMLLYRFASSIHADMGSRNTLGYANRFMFDLKLDHSDEFFPDEVTEQDQWNMFYMSMLQTERPQLMFLASTKIVEDKIKFNSVHAILAYRIEGNKIYVYDPNFPGQERYIEFTDNHFGPYTSGSNAQAIEDGDEHIFNHFYYYGEYMAINTYEIERRWQEVVNKDLENDYFPYPIVLSDDIESFDPIFEFNVEMFDSSLNDKYQIRIYNENLSKANLMLMPDLVSLADGPTPLYPPSENGIKLSAPLNKAGDNWVGLYLTNKDGKWAYFNWYKIFKDSELKLSSDKYTIAPNETATIVTYLESGIDYPDPDWTVDYEPVNHVGKTYTFSSEEPGDHFIEANHSLYTDSGSIIITVDSDYIESEDTIIDDNQQSLIDGTYTCSFTMVSANASPYLPFENPSQRDIDRANENIIWVGEDYQKHVGEVIMDRDQFSVSVNDDGTCDVSFSPSLGFQLGGMTGGSDIPFSGGSLNWTSNHNNDDYDVTITFSPSEDGVKMKGRVTYTTHIISWVTKVLQVFEFEGEKIN